jgi:CheY-like chemotaxis protein
MKKRILIVDDQDRIRDIYRNLFINEGFGVIEAADAQAANEIIKNQQLDLILLDIKMPQVGGQTLYEVIRLFHKNKAKIVVSSVYPLTDQQQMVPGADDYYDKSQGVDILLTKIKKALGN